MRSNILRSPPRKRGPSLGAIVCLALVPAFAGTNGRERVTHFGKRTKCATSTYDPALDPKLFTLLLVLREISLR
jgi:hypothetical protein